MYLLSNIWVFSFNYSLLFHNSTDGQAIDNHIRAKDFLAVRRRWGRSDINDDGFVFICTHFIAPIIGRPETGHHGPDIQSGLQGNPNQLVGSGRSERRIEKFK